MRSQGYGVNGALCPFKWSLSWAKEMGDREAYRPDPDLASPRLWWSWALGCGRQAPFFPQEMDPEPNPSRTSKELKERLHRPPDLGIYNLFLTGRNQVQ